MSKMPQQAPSESSSQPTAAAKQSPIGTSTQRTPTTRVKVRHDRRVRWLLATTVLVMATTAVALNQKPWPLSYDPPRSFGLDWWLHPIEQNAYQRLPVATTAIHDLWTSSSGDRVWAVGDGGLILTSDDGGAHWLAKGTIRMRSSRMPDRGTHMELHSVWFTDPNNGWLGGIDGQILRTSDSGSSWQLHSVFGQDTVVDIGFPTPEVGCLLSSEPDPGFFPEPRIFAVSRDGGTTWRGQARTSVRQLFVDSTGCWLALNDRIVRYDVDSDQILDEVTIPSSPPLLSITKSTSGTLWAAGIGNLFRVPPSSAPESVLSPFGTPLLVSPTRTGAWVVDLYGRVGRATDIGSGSLIDVLPPLNDVSYPPYDAVASLRDDRLLVASGGWLLIVGGDSTTTRRARTRNGDVGLHSIHFFDRLRGVASHADRHGTDSLRVTDDGGRTWNPVLADTVEPARVGFRGKDFGWAATGIRLFFSNDAGASWNEQPAAATRSLAATFSPDGVGLSIESGNLSITTDNASSWERLAYSGPPLLDLTNLRRAGPSTVASDALSTEGRLLTLELRIVPSPVVVFSPVDDRSRPNARSIARVDGRLWVGGLDGLSIVGEATDEQVTDRPVLSFFFLDRQTGWIAEPGGGLLFTEDGGITWTDLTPYRIYPAPWYWLACIVSLLLLAPAFRQPPAQEVHRSVAEMAVSDRPIEAGDPDPLDFGAVALGLSRFLRNSATQPPLTLAVTGEWGTGKSSLMNLLRADLARYGFQPVWFNAWHHQKEEQLLAALLVNIRRQAIPSLFSPEGWAFRGRLLAHRMRRWRLLTLFLTLGFGALTGWVATSSEGAGLMTRVWETLEKLNPAAWLAPGGEALEPGMTAFLVAALAVLFIVGRGLRAFGVDPGTLVAGLSSRASRRDARAQAGFRHCFAREFEDVTRALRPRTLTLLIDDLDRCRPQNVLDVLEAVNFLVSSGRCYVVLGIDREMVERFVGYGFREVAEEILDRDFTAGEGEGDADDDGRARRAAFARQYLEKLINIEVAVPRVGEAAGRGLVRPPEPKADAKSRGQRLAGWLRSLPGRWWALPAVIAVTLMVGLWLGSRLGDKPPPPVAETPTAAPVTVEPQTEPEIPDEAAVPGEDVPAPETTDGEEIATGPPARLIPGEEGDRHYLWFWLAIGLLLAVATIWMLTTLPEVEVHDSPEFVEALDAWFPLLHAETPTPRSIKRFLNKVRCYAMRQRPAEPPRTRLGAVGDWLRKLVGKPQAVANDLREPPDQIPERALVALAAVEHVYPHLLGDTDFWMDPWMRQVTEDQEGHALSIAEVVGSDLPEIHPYRRAFTGLSRGIETH